MREPPAQLDAARPRPDKRGARPGGQQHRPAPPPCTPLTPPRPEALSASSVADGYVRDGERDHDAMLREAAESRVAAAPDLDERAAEHILVLRAHVKAGAPVGANHRLRTTVVHHDSGSGAHPPREGQVTEP